MFLWKVCVGGLPTSVEVALILVGLMTDERPITARDRIGWNYSFLILIMMLCVGTWLLCGAYGMLSS